MKKIPLVLTAAVIASLAACFDTSQSGVGGSGTAAATVGPGGGQHSLADPLDSRPAFRLGDPIPGLTHAERAAFERGREVFKRRFKPSEGLGPLYNATACSSCHSHPVAGGSAPLYRNFFIAVRDLGGFQLPLSNLPSVVVPGFGSGPHFATTFTLTGRRREIPAMETGFPVIVAQRNSIPIFGTGLFEFVSDATIMGLSDPDDGDGDGISGRFNTDVGAQSSIGRFGVKLQSNAVEFFTRGPLQNQMGITSIPFEGSGAIVSLCSALRPQGGSGADDPTTDNDGIPDPEITPGDLGDLIAFTRFLAPPQPKPFNAEASAGEALFASTGCVKCHIPELPSSRGPVRAYTDLLLHEVGNDLADGINFGAPQASTISPALNTGEFRTQPLWGVSLHAPFLHDGRAETLREAIELHGGEAESIRDDFLLLSQAEQDSIIAFLEHL